MTYFSQQIPALIFAAGLGAITAGPAFAQDGDGAMAHQGNYDHHGRGQQMAQHHHRLQQALKLTAEQQPAWQTLMETERSPRQSTDATPAELVKMTVPERAERKLARARTALERQTEHVAALKALYQTLTPEQKQAFEDFHAIKGHGMGHKSGHRTKQKSEHTTGHAPPSKP